MLLIPPGWMIFHLWLRTSGRNISSQLTGFGPQWAAAPRENILITYLHLVNVVDQRSYLSSWKSHECRFGIRCNIYFYYNQCSTCVYQLIDDFRHISPSGHLLNMPLCVISTVQYAYYKKLDAALFKLYVLTRDGYCTMEIKMRITIAKEAFNRKISLLTSKLNIELRNKLFKRYLWSIAFLTQRPGH